MLGCARTLSQVPPSALILPVTCAAVGLPDLQAAVCPALRPLELSVPWECVDQLANKRPIPAHVGADNADWTDMSEDETEAALIPDQDPVVGGVDDDDDDTLRIVSVLGGSRRVGRWRIPSSTSVMALFGRTTIDLRDV